MDIQYSQISVELCTWFKTNLMDTSIDNILKNVFFNFGQSINFIEEEVYLLFLGGRDGGGKVN